MPTLVVELDVLDAAAWERHNRTGDAALDRHGLSDSRVYTDGARTCLVMQAETFDGAAAFLADSGWPALFDAGVIGVPSIRLLEAVGIATISDGTMRVDRLWPRGKGR